MQAPPPTTLDPETQRQLRHLFDHATDTTNDLAWVLIVMVGVVLVLFSVALILVVAATWQRAKDEQVRPTAVDRPSTPVHPSTGSP